MRLYDTLIDLLDEARGRDRTLRLIDGENDETTVRFPEIWDRALALLGSMQARGLKSGDELVIFSKSNEKFAIAFWAAILGALIVSITSTIASWYIGPDGKIEILVIRRD